MDARRPSGGASRTRRAPWRRCPAGLRPYLSGMFISGRPRALINVVPSPTIASLIGGLLPSI